MRHRCVQCRPVTIDEAAHFLHNRVVLILRPGEGMFGHRTRRDFLVSSASLAGAALFGSAMPQRGKSATTKGPNDFIIVEGQRDIWELSGRTRIREEAQRWPLTNFIVPRLI